jgi:hypothetical protein
MTITLTDLPAATDTYLHDQVDVRIGRVTENLQPGEEGTLSVRWTNASAPTGIRLTDVVLHLTSSDDSVAQLKVPSQTLLQTRATNDINAPAPASGSLLDEMFVFLPAPGVVAGIDDIDSTLDVGEVSELEFSYRAIGVGRTTFSAHVHAVILAEDLFPRGRGDDGSRAVDVRS